VSYRCSIRRSSGVWQEVRSIPLSAYFVAVAALVAAPMLLVKLVFEPSKAEGSAPPATKVETTVRAPRTTTGTAPTAPAATDETASKSSKKAQPRSSHGGVGIARANREGRYSTYAETTPSWRSTAQGTLGPH